MGVRDINVEMLAKFLADEDTKELFAALDFALLNGEHVQAEHPEQRLLFEFLQKNHLVLAFFYHTYFRLNLEQRTEGQRSYYFLWQQPGIGSLVPVKFRKELSPEAVIVAMLLCKVSLIDNQLDSFESVEELITFLQEEYEPYREGLFKQLARLRGSQEISRDEEKVKQLVKRSLEEFRKLGWLYKDEAEHWYIMPALDRIRDIYSNEIAKMSTIFFKQA